jgi:hypothetical protein
MCARARCVCLLICTSVYVHVLVFLHASTFVLCVSMCMCESMHTCEYMCASNEYLIHELNFKPSAHWKFTMTLNRDRGRDHGMTLNRDRDHGMTLNRDHGMTLNRDRDHGALNRDRDCDHGMTRNRDLDRDHGMTLDRDRGMNFDRYMAFEKLVFLHMFATISNHKYKQTCLNYSVLIFDQKCHIFDQKCHIFDQLQVLCQVCMELLVLHTFGSYHIHLSLCYFYFNQIKHEINIPAISNYATHCCFNQIKHQINSASHV